MFKRALLFIIIVFCACQSHAQIDSFPGIKDVLKQGSIAAIREYAIQIKIDACDIGLGGPYSIESHEITPHFHEGIISIYRCSAEGSGSSIHNVTISFLSYDSTIIYTSIRRWREPTEYTTTINPSLYMKLLQSYRDTYGVELNTDELFTEGVFGIGGCGYGGIPTDEYLEMEKQIRKKNIPKLQKQLRSANIVSQLYAVYAFMQLEKEGYKPSNETKRLIDYVKRKEGTVLTCSGCFFGEEKITDIAKEF